MHPNVLPLIQAYERPQRVALSRRYPLFRPLIIALRRWMRTMQNGTNPRIARTKSNTWLPCIVTRHQSLLLRVLGNADIRLQHNKIQNLRQAIIPLNGLIIQPGKIFSFWHTIGKPTERKGYVPGMLLSEGKVREGTGGGLCQLSNLLFWMFLHADVDVIERYHHSFDVFPDEKRTLPFGSGATVFFNYVDVQVQNMSSHPMQLKLWLTDKHLKGQILSSHPPEKKFHIVERQECFIRRKNRYFRYNELWRESYEHGKKTEETLFIRNFAPVLYPVDDTYLENRRVLVMEGE